MSQITSLSSYRTHELEEMTKAGISENCERLVLAYAGDPDLTDDPIVFKWILEAYNKDCPELLSCFGIEIPESIAPAQYKKTVITICETAKALLTAQNLKPRDPTQAPLALAPILERVMEINLMKVYNAFTEKVKETDYIAEVKRFTKQINGMRTREMAKEIRTWMPLHTDILKTVTTISLVNKNLSVVPPELFMLENLERLDLSDNLLTMLPEAITGLKKLKSLSLANNKWTPQIQPIVLTLRAQKCVVIGDIDPASYFNPALERLMRPRSSSYP